MKKYHLAVRIIFLVIFVMPSLALSAYGQSAKSAASKYPKMAPVEEYLMDRDAEIALARTAGPATIAKDADVFVLGRHGYENAVKGTNGFACMVDRSWSAPADDPNFWNPKLRGPECYNAPGVRSYMPIIMRKAELILAGKSKEEMLEAMRSAFDKKELPLPEANAMCYMFSSQQYLGDGNGRWHPHLMFFVSPVDQKVWGAEAPDAPIVVQQDADDRLTILMIPVGKWSDGTTAPPI